MRSWKWVILFGCSFVFLANSLAKSNMSQLAGAVKRGELGEVGLLLDEGLDANGEHRGRSMLHTALQHGKLDVAELLIERGAYPHERVRVPYVNSFGDKTHYRAPLLIYVVLKGDLRAVRLLHRSGVRLIDYIDDWSDYRGADAFYFACARQEEEIALYLLNNGVDPTKFDGVDNGSALTLAAYFGMKDVVFEAFDKGFDVEVSTSSWERAGPLAQLVAEYYLSKDEKKALMHYQIARGLYRKGVGKYESWLVDGPNWKEMAIATFGLMVDSKQDRDRGDRYFPMSGAHSDLAGKNQKSVKHLEFATGYMLCSTILACYSENPGMSLEDVVEMVYDEFPRG